MNESKNQTSTNHGEHTLPDFSRYCGQKVIGFYHDEDNVTTYLVYSAVFRRVVEFTVEYFGDDGEPDGPFPGLLPTRDKRHPLCCVPTDTTWLIDEAELGSIESALLLADCFTRCLP